MEGEDEGMDRTSSRSVSKYMIIDIPLRIPESIALQMIISESAEDLFENNIGAPSAKSYV